MAEGLPFDAKAEAFWQAYLTALSSCRSGFLTHEILTPVMNPHEPLTYPR
jgi:hypothetical protein